MAADRRPVVWSPEAEADLSDIWNYIANANGPRVADGVARNIADACRVLEDHRLAGRARSEVRTGLRSIAASPYVIFYRVRGHVAELVRILDGRRDIDDIFSDEQ